MKTVPSFESEKDRQQWFIANADYFTVVRLRNRRYERHEEPTLEAAKQTARRILKEGHNRPFMIYAVVNNSDSFVEMVAEG